MPVNPKVNPCLPITPYAMAFNASLPYRRSAAVILVESGVRPRHIRKALLLSGRQLRKAQRSANLSPVLP